MFRKLLTDNKHIHEISIQLADNINVHLNKEGIEKIKLQYGLEIMLIDFTKLIIVISIALLIGALVETIIVLAIFNILRFKAYGVHAKGALECLIISIVLFNILPFVCSFTGIDNLGVAICFIFVFVILLVYSPADTENTPIIGIARRRRFKAQSLVIAGLLLTIALSINNEQVKLLMCLGVVLEAISLLPITYKLLRKERNNYEKHEGESKRNHKQESRGCCS